MRASWISIKAEMSVHTGTPPLPSPIIVLSLLASSTPLSPFKRNGFPDRHARPDCRLRAFSTQISLTLIQVGGGPSGLILAITLAMNDIPVRIIEREAQHRKGSKGSGIAVSSQAAASHARADLMVAAAFTRGLSLPRPRRRRAGGGAPHTAPAPARARHDEGLARMVYVREERPHA
jgi:hypothetical protein